MPAKITSKQETRIGDLVIAAVRTLDLTTEEAQEIIKAGGTLQEEIKQILGKLAIEDKRFGPTLSEFDFMVPAGYDHATQMDEFGKRTKDLPATYYWNDALTSANFAKATRQLEPGKTYRVKIFPILCRVTSFDCLTFLQKQKAILAGGQGLTLLQEYQPDQFPVCKYTVSFDEKNALWEDSGGYHGVPQVYRHLDCGWRFDLGGFEGGWFDDSCLVCFCDL